MVYFRNSVVILGRYNEDIDLEDAIHTAILTLKEGFEGQMNETNIEIGVIGPDRQFKVSVGVCLWRGINDALDFNSQYCKRLPTSAWVEYICIYVFPSCNIINVAPKSRNQKQKQINHVNINELVPLLYIH